MVACGMDWLCVCVGARGYGCWLQVTHVVYPGYIVIQITVFVKGGFTSECLLTKCSIRHKRVMAGVGELVSVYLPLFVTH